LFQDVSGCGTVEQVDPDNIHLISSRDFGILQNLSLWQKRLLSIERCQQTSAKKFASFSLVGGVLWWVAGGGRSAHKCVSEGSLQIGEQEKQYKSRRKSKRVWGVSERRPKVPAVRSVEKTCCLKSH